ncbi:MAG: aspartate aminotransferase family protein [Sphingomonadales bacterium]
MPVRPNSPAQRDIDSLVHPYTNLARHAETGPLIIERGKGIYVYDDDGREYIEGMSGLWCTSLGFGEEKLVEAAAEQMRKLPFSQLFTHRSTEPAIALAERLKAMAPVPISKVLFSSSGSEANDSVIKLVWYYNNALGRPEKKKIIARDKAYHGVSVAATSLTCLPVCHNDFDMPLDRFLHAGCPHHYRFAAAGESEEAFADRLASELEEQILREGPDTVAAFFAEPVMGAGGVLVPPRTYFPKIQAVLDRYDILLISDEVICGFGRTANMFGCETVDMTPDIMTVAKALSSAYLPISAALIPEEVHQAMLDESRKLGSFGHGNTYSGHPVCAAVALRTIELMEERDILGHVRAVSPRFQRRLSRLADHPLVGEARGAGLVGGLELVADKATKRSFDPSHQTGMKCVDEARGFGLIARAIGDTVALCPPLIITEAEIDEMFDRLTKALDVTEGIVSREGMRAA